MKKQIYQNVRNENKYIEVVHYACGHYHAVQFMQWDNVINKLGSRTGRRFRFRKQSLADILEDYVPVGGAA